MNKEQWCYTTPMPLSVEQLQQTRMILQMYRVQLRAIVAQHKINVHRDLEEVDRRRAAKLAKTLRNT